MNKNNHQTIINMYETRCAFTKAYSATILLLLATLISFSHSNASNSASILLSSDDDVEFQLPKKEHYHHDDNQYDTKLTIPDRHDSGNMEKCPHSNQKSSNSNEQMLSTPHRYNQGKKIEKVSWQFVPGPMKLEEPQVNDQKQELNDDEDHQQHQDTGFEMVNNRFWISNENDKNQQHLEDQMKNWATWRAIISYFPSGQDRLKKQRQHLEDNFHLKGRQQLLDSSNKQPNDEQKVSLVEEKTSIPIPIHQDNKTLTTKVVTKNLISDRQNEVEDQMKYDEPLAMYIMDDDEIRMLYATEDDDVIKQEGKQQQQQFSSAQKLPDSINEVKKLDLEQKGNLDRYSLTTAVRARDSLLKAADVARKLSSKNDSKVLKSATNITTNNVTHSIYDSTFESTTNSELRNSRDSSSTRGIEMKDDESSSSSLLLNNNSTTITNNQLTPKFLGYGQLQRIDPFRGNERTQARLSCRFGFDNDIKNMSISDVEWAKFSGDYDTNQIEPPFKCTNDNWCQLTPVKTDTLVTVHPRPAIQNYVNTMVPNYSVTLHEVNENHLGVYRCSALRRLETNGTKTTTELVYRIIPLLE